MQNLDQYLNKAIELAMLHGPKLLMAMITLIVGLVVIRVGTRVFGAVMERARIDATLRPFLTSMLGWILKVLLFVSVASMIGIETTSFIAVLGAAGLAVGLALQGSLSNFAGGVLVLIFRPYEVGHLIEAQGLIGVVKEIQIFTTILINPQGKRVIIPNGPMANGNIVNYTAEGSLRVDTVIGVAYNADIGKAKEALLAMLVKHDKVLDTPEPSVNVLELADSSVNLAVRPHCRPEDYWDVYFYCHEQGKKVLDEENISIPFPQRDVHLFEMGKGAA